MAPNPRRQDEGLDALYARLPKIECQGLCHDSCGPIEMSLRERTRIESVHGKVESGSTSASCSMLDENRRCRAYANRPMICRLWGIMDRMPCIYGCKPERLLTSAEAADFLAEADRIGGDPGGRGPRLEQHLRAAKRALGYAAYEASVDEVMRMTVSPADLHDRERAISAPTIIHNTTGVEP